MGGIFGMEKSGQGNLKEALKLTAREAEERLLNFCILALKGETVPQNEKEANVLRLASYFIAPAFPEYSKKLATLSDQYFSNHPNEIISSGEMVRRGYVIGLPRFRDMLARKLQENK